MKISLAVLIAAILGSTSVAGQAVQSDSSSRLLVVPLVPSGWKAEAKRHEKDDLLYLTLSVNGSTTGKYGPSIPKLVLICQLDKAAKRKKVNWDDDVYISFHISAAFNGPSYVIPMRWENKKAHNEKFYVSYDNERLEVIHPKAFVARLLTAQRLRLWYPDHLGESFAEFDVHGFSEYARRGAVCGW